MKITTDNPGDPTRLRASGTSILTITLDTTHDRDGSPQTCNSHTVAAGCGSMATGQPMDLFGYTITLVANGGVVTWGTFTPADANFTPVGGDLASSTQTEFSRFAQSPDYSVAPGLSTLGSISVTPTGGAPRIDIAHGTQQINPFGFGTMFAGHCDAFQYPNSYMLADPNNLCGTGDWIDVDGASSGVDDFNAPVISASPTASATEGVAMSVITATASDADPGDILTITQSGMPADLTFTTNSPGVSPRTASISGTPGFADAGSYNIVWTVSDGRGGSAATTTALTIADASQPPVLDPIADAQTCGPQVVNRAIRATDPDGDAITLSATGPTWMSLTSNFQVGNVRTGNLRFAPSAVVTGIFPISVTASSGSASDTKNFTVTIACGAPFYANTPLAMTVPVNGSADQPIRATQQHGAPVTFSKVSGPAFVTVTTTDPGAGTALGNIHLAPGFSDAGTYTVTVRAESETLGIQSSFTVTVCTGCGSVPALAPIANMTVGIFGAANQTITATDVDGQPLTFSTAYGPGAVLMEISTTNAGAGTATGNIRLSPGASDVGSHNAAVRVSDGVLSDMKDFSFIVTSLGGPPVMNPIPTPNITLGGCSPLRAGRGISATDPDADAITFTWSGPPWVSVTPNQQSGTTLTGSLDLGPPTSTGTFNGSVTANAGGQSDTKFFTVNVVSLELVPPVLSQPADMTAHALHITDQTITAANPCASNLNFSKLAGPGFMSVTTGRIRLTPGASDVGTYSAVVRVQSSVNGASDTKSLTITVVPNGAPTLNPMANMDNCGPADQVVTGSDPEGDVLSFSLVSNPPWVTLTLATPTGHIHVAPPANTLGTFSVIVRVFDGEKFAEGSFTVILRDCNRCPSASPGGPYSGLAGVPVTLDGTASSDPEGDPLTYAWDFDSSNGIQVDAVGSQVTHTFAAVGTFTVTLTVTDNGHGVPARACSNSSTTTMTTQPSCTATVFNGYDTIKLNSGKPYWFAYVQPANTCYNNSDIVIPSFVMKYAGRQISASGKTAIVGDKSGDGIQEIQISFLKEDLRTLFTGTGLANGHNTVTVTLEANLATGGRLSGTTQLDVVNNGGFNVAVSPNPLNPQATLTWTTSKAGFARIEMFDIQGRLVRRLVDEIAMAAGAHEATIDGHDQRGESLPSGVYFIRGTLSEGDFKQIITILK